MITLGIPEALIHLIDDLPPEDVAMLQALYSRSGESVAVHVKRLLVSLPEDSVGPSARSERFMEKFYVNYGHKSIADCGTTTLFIEGVSLLAAKAVQDSPLYNGQETSTRFLDMGAREIRDPMACEGSSMVIAKWMDFYRTVMPETIDHVRATHPRRDGEKESDYEGAVRARAFDIMRGFLPAGITTQLSWHTNLRQAGDRLTVLVHHPSPEIRAIAEGLRGILKARYPSSGLGMSLPGVSGVGRNDADAAARAEWEHYLGRRDAYPSHRLCERFRDGMVEMESSLDSFRGYDDIITTRPRGAVLPHFLTDLGQIRFRFLLDFGSFRDIQRHRNGVCRMPLLDTAYGFERWYIDNLPESRRREAEMLVLNQTGSLTMLAEDDRIAAQYATAIGFRVPCNVMYALPAAVYVMELRSGKPIHPTLRRVILEMARLFSRAYPHVPLHVDRDPDDWTVRRGAQTITERGGAT